MGLEKCNVGSSLSSMIPLLLTFFDPVLIPPPVPVPLPLPPLPPVNPSSSYMGLEKCNVGSSLSSMIPLLLPLARASFDPVRTRCPALNMTPGVSRYIGLMKLIGASSPLLMLMLHDVASFIPSPPMPLSFLSLSLSRSAPALPPLLPVVV